MNNSCANPCFGCNCDANDYEWREDSGLLTDKTKLSVIQRVHGDAGRDNQGYIPHSWKTELLWHSIKAKLL